MAVKLVSVKCPQCGASLDIDEGRNHVFCSYCGTKILVDNDNEYIYRHIDEASIKQTEAETMLRLKEMELQEKEDERNRKSRKNAYIVATALVVFGALIAVIGGSEWGLIIIGIGMCVAVSPAAANSKKKKSRIETISPNEIRISEKMEHYKEKDYNSIVGLFRAAGFENVYAVPLNDLNIFTAKKNRQVDDVTIDGSNEFEEGDVFQKSAKVTVIYHSVK